MNLQHIRQISPRGSAVERLKPSVSVNYGRFRIVINAETAGGFSSVVIGIDSPRGAIGPTAASTHEAILKGLIHLNTYIEETGDCGEVDFLRALAQAGKLTEHGVIRCYTKDPLMKKALMYRDAPYYFIEYYAGFYRVNQRSWSVFNRFIVPYFDLPGEEG